jgi:hypothetical protein
LLVGVDGHGPMRLELHALADRRAPVEPRELVFIEDEPAPGASGTAQRSNEWRRRRRSIVALSPSSSTRRFQVWNHRMPSDPARRFGDADSILPDRRAGRIVAADAEEADGGLRRNGDGTVRQVRHEEVEEVAALADRGPARLEELGPSKWKGPFSGRVFATKTSFLAAS